MSDFVDFWSQFIQGIWNIKIWGSLHIQALLTVVFVIWILSIIFGFVSGKIERG